MRKFGRSLYRYTRKRYTADIRVCHVVDEIFRPRRLILRKAVLCERESDEAGGRERFIYKGIRREEKRNLKFGICGTLPMCYRNPFGESNLTKSRLNRILCELFSHVLTNILSKLRIIRINFRDVCKYPGARRSR